MARTRTGKTGDPDEAGPVKTPRVPRWPAGRCRPVLPRNPHFRRIWRCLLISRPGSINCFCVTTFRKVPVVRCRLTWQVIAPLMRPAMPGQPSFVKMGSGPKGRPRRLGRRATSVPGPYSPPPRPRRGQGRASSQEPPFAPPRYRRVPSGARRSRSVVTRGRLAALVAGRPQTQPYRNRGCCRRQPGRAMPTHRNALRDANARRTRRAGPAAARLAGEALGTGCDLPAPLRQALELRAAHPRTSWTALAGRAATTKDALVGRYRRGLAMVGVEIPVRPDPDMGSRTSRQRPARAVTASHDDGRITNPQPTGRVRPRAPELDERDQRIVAAARADLGQTTRELADRCGVTYQVAWNALREANVRVRPGNRPAARPR